MPAADAPGRDSPAYAAEMEKRKHCHRHLRRRRWFLLYAPERTVARCMLTSTAVRLLTSPPWATCEIFFNAPSRCCSRFLTPGCALKSFAFPVFGFVHVQKSWSLSQNHGLFQTNSICYCENNINTTTTDCANRNILACSYNVRGEIGLQQLCQVCSINSTARHGKRNYQS